MIPSILNSETHVTQIEIQNEIKTIESKKPTNNSLISVRYSELLRQENAKECKRNAEKIKVVNGNVSAANIQVCGNFFTSTNVYKMETGDANAKKKGLNSKKKKPVRYPTKYWVQFGVGNMEVDNPLSYDPDRNSFVAKVFFITFVMLVCTAAFVSYVCISDYMRAIFLDEFLGKILFFAGGAGMTVLSYGLMCSPCFRMFPCNIVVLIIAVICMSLITAFMTASFETVVIAYALVATAITVLVCMLLALTSFDFTKFFIYVFVIGISFSVLTVIIFISFAVLGIYLKVVHMVLLFVGTLINIVVLIMQLQAILGGKTIELGEDEFAIGAYMLYTSIIDIFLKLLQLIGFFISEGDDLF